MVTVSKGNCLHAPGCCTSPSFEVQQKVRVPREAPATPWAFEGVSFVSDHVLYQGIYVSQHCLFVCKCEVDYLASGILVDEDARAQGALVVRSAEMVLQLEA